jgi:hypothetical protein
MTTPTDLLALVGNPEPVTLESGFGVQILDLKTRQLLRLLKIITTGAGPLLPSFKLYEDDQTPEEFGAKLLGLIIIAIPEAEDETIDFVQSMVQPAGLRAERSKSDKIANEPLWSALRVQLENPSLDDLVTIFEEVVQREAPHIQSLGKRLSSIWTLAVKTAQVGQSSKSSSGTGSEPSSASTRVDSSEASPESSTSSRSSTGGPTTSSLTSQLLDSGR